jgi:hypothetical protein
MNHTSAQPDGVNKWLFLATSRFYDYFQQMGGAAMYPGFRYWHVPAFVILALSSDQKDALSYQVETTISPRLDHAIGKLADEWMAELYTQKISKQELIEYSIDILRRLLKLKNWIGEVDEWTDFLSKQRIQLPRDCLPEIVRYNGRRVKIIENSKSPNAYLSDDFALCIFDKRISAGVGEAIQLDDGSFKGYIQCGMHELPISGDDYRELASSAYSQILESEKY